MGIKEGPFIRSKSKGEEGPSWCQECWAPSSLGGRKSVSISALAAHCPAESAIRGHVIPVMRRNWQARKVPFSQDPERNGGVSCGTQNKPRTESILSQLKKLYIFYWNCLRQRCCPWVTWVGRQWKRKFWVCRIPPSPCLFTNFH